MTELFFTASYNEIHWILPVLHFRAFYPLTDSLFGVKFEPFTVWKIINMFTEAAASYSQQKLQTENDAEESCSCNSCTYFSQRLMGNRNWVKMAGSLEIMTSESTEITLTSTVVTHYSDGFQPLQHIQPCRVQQADVYLIPHHIISVGDEEPRTTTWFRVFIKRIKPLSCWNSFQGSALCVCG